VASAAPAWTQGNLSELPVSRAGAGSSFVQWIPSPECHRSRPWSDSPCQNDSAASQPPVRTGHAATNSLPWP